MVGACIRSLNSHSIAQASSADVQRRFRVAAAAFHGLARIFRANSADDDVNLLFTICAGEQFLDDRFLMVFFLYCSATRPTSNDGPGVRYFRGEVLPAMSDSQARFLFSFRLLFSVGLNFENVTVLCFDFCDYETFVLLFPLFFYFLCGVCGLINHKNRGGAGNYA